MVSVFTREPRACSRSVLRDLGAIEEPPALVSTGEGPAAAWPLVGAEPAMEGTPVASIDAADLTLDSFVANHYGPDQPLVIRGLAGDWPAVTAWGGPAGIREVCRGVLGPPCCERIRACGELGTGGGDGCGGPCGAIGVWVRCGDRCPTS